jgi:Eco57I restriction-modification methylase
MTPAVATDQAHAWWSRLRHQGLLLSPVVLLERFPEAPEPAAWHILRSLRDRHTHFQAAETEDERGRPIDLEKSTVLTWLDSVLRLNCDYGAAHADGRYKASQIPDSLRATVRIGSRTETLRPDRVIYADSEGETPALLVVADTSPKVGQGRGRTTYARLLELLRGTGQRLGLISNGRQIRLVYAGLDFESWCEWDTAKWFDRGEGDEEMAGLRQIISPASLALDGDGSAGLLNAIEESRKKQADLSGVLRENVRRAVEDLLIEVSSASRTNPALLEVIEQRPGDGQRLSDTEVHEALLQASVRIVMRLVVTLFAESREMLPINSPVYISSYGVRSLYELLQQTIEQEGSHTLAMQGCAWPRLIALFRLIHRGSFHKDLPIRAYGSDLFRPGEADSDDPVSRALYVVEGTDPEKNVPVTDATIHAILRKLLRGPLPVIRGRSRTYVEGPVDYTHLRTEFIGLIYEGVLDYRLRRVSVDPQVFLNIGAEPVLPLNRLEQMLEDDPKGLRDLITKLRKEKTTKGPEAEEDEDSGDDEDEGDDTQGSETEDSVEIEGEEEATTEREGFLEADQRARRWARDAVKLAKIVGKKKKGESTADYDRRVEKEADDLITRVIAPGEFYLVRAGNVRKGTGTFYTRPQLAVPTVHRTLEPLCFDIERDVDGKVTSRTPKKPEVILGLKVCDPACGSASFLVAALHCLTDALYASLRENCGIEDPDRARDIALPYGRPRTGADGEDLIPFPPDDPQRGDHFADTIKARLRRHIVERCIYGVDINPMAIELARVSLWVETLDPDLPFSFLDHKIKVGNALVGCWFDRFQDYPAMAWEREGGDKSHTTGVHFQKEAWTKAIKRAKSDVVKPELADLIARMTSAGRGEMPGLFSADEAAKVHDDTARLYQDIHERLRLIDPDHQAERYRTEFVENEAVNRLRAAFDTWCAIWFWPADRLDIAPIPSRFFDPPAETRTEVERLGQAMRFFHWEIEFPDVFTTERAGFDAVLGNPPWETLQPNSKEWFSNIDPIYRTYGKQVALVRQRECFDAEDDIEREWLFYTASFKAMANWQKQMARPFGDVTDDEGANFSLSRSAAQSVGLHEQWARLRSQRDGYADPEHPFVHQGEGKPYTYKMFTELAHAVLQHDGRLGLIVPSGIYTDRGSTALRSLFLGHCRWEWIFGFENRDGIFDIHRAFKFCPVIVQKGGESESIRAAFMVRELTAWEVGERHVLDYPRERVEQFSPHSRAILEICSDRDLTILEKMYANGVLLGDDGPDGWGIQYAQGDFNLTTDSKLFPPLPKWEAKGYVPDQYGHWLKGKWLAVTGGVDAASRVKSRDGSRVVAIEDIEDVAVPLYEGRMIGQFDFSQKGWVSGKGRGAVWRKIAFDDKVVEPQYLMGSGTFDEEHPVRVGYKIAYMDVTSATNRRTTHTTPLEDWPCGHRVNLFKMVRHPNGVEAFSALLNSFAYDYVMRQRLGGIIISYFISEETVVPAPKLIIEAQLLNRFSSHALRLTGISTAYASAWVEILHRLDDSRDRSILEVPWRRLWAVAPYERLRLRCILDAVVAHLYGLDAEDLRWILRDCDHPPTWITNSHNARTLDPKGFWRVGKTEYPEHRHAVLTLVAFAALQDLIANHGEEEGLRLFLGTGPDDGWMLPETLRLADHGLGHDDRARQHQPVAPALGPRFYDWQLSQSAEESWEECRMHAEKIRRIRSIGAPTTSVSDDPPKKKRGRRKSATTPHMLNPQPEQGEMF